MAIRSNAGRPEPVQADVLLEVIDNVLAGLVGFFPNDVPAGDWDASHGLR